MAYGAVGPKAINIGALEPLSGTSSAALFCSTTAATVAVSPGQCYRVFNFIGTSAVLLGIGGTVLASGTVTGTAISAAVPPGGITDLMIPGGTAYGALSYGSFPGTAIAALVPHAQSQ